MTAARENDLVRDITVMMEKSGLRPLDLLLGAAVAVFGLATAARSFVSAANAPLLPGTPATAIIAPVVIALGTAVAVTLYRRAPAAALATVWATAIVQLLAGLDIAFVQLAVVIVAYGTSRYGRTATVIASIASIPLAGVAVVVYAWIAGIGTVVRDSGLRELVGSLVAAAGVGIYDLSTGLAIGFVLVVAFLGAPWALGLVVRLRERSRTAERELAEAEAEATRSQQLAEVRSEQARLARDVHDVVGHSLAVIVAQADSARALPDDQIERIRASVAAIADTARRSLRDVRTVLSDDPASVHSSDDLGSLIEGVRSGGTDVALAVIGTPRPLPPELEVVAYRTLQELLTNALKHGAVRDGIDVRLNWEVDDLVVTVSNTIAEAPGPGAGSGLAGVRDRVTAVGGSVAWRSEHGRWTTTARVPTRPEGGAP